MAVASVMLASTFTLAFFAACAEDSDEDDDNTSVSATDTQTIKNGNFEFYSEMDEDVTDRLALINSPTSWSFTAGSPSSTVNSGILDTSTEAWNNITRTGGYAFETYEYSGENSDYVGTEVTTFTSIADAIAHWEDEGVNAYDRLYFYEIYQDDIDALDDDDEQATFFDDYSYSVDYEDVKYLKDVETNGAFRLHDGVADDETSVLMIHNLVTSNYVVGTAQYYTSSTTITLAAGTAAEVSVWVRTDNLYHYNSTDTENPESSGDAVDRRAGAYIGVTNTVGGTSLDQMQIKNINTNGAWEQYTVYVRASTFATTTFKIVLGLGQGSSTDRYEHVNGYAFFDDLTCKIISSSDFDDATSDGSSVRTCTIKSLKDEKIFDMDVETASTYALDLYAAFDADDTLLNSPEIALTSEKTGVDGKLYTTANLGLGDDESNYASVTTLTEIASKDNKYLKNIYENDLKDKYPFEDEQFLMLMSANGAAYTAKLPELTLEKDERMLVSFFVKTSSIPSGYSGAGATVVELVDGAEVNRTSISAFDSTTLSTVDIDDDTKDIYSGWAQCFFFIENSTDKTASFRIELTYGPTTIVGTSKTDYVDGYAAFANFETATLTKTEYSYASTGSQAVSVSLTGEVQETKVFDSVSAAAQNDVETGLALPASFTGVLGGSKFVTAGGADNVMPEDTYAGLLNAQYVEAYYASSDAWRDALASDKTNADDWWQSFFGNARQPLVIINGESTSYGYYSANLSISASSYQKISMRVKVSAGAKAYIYLSDVSSAETTGTPITPNAPAVTYWYNDYGDICRVDPTSKDYNSKTDVLFELQDNGLYTKVGGDASTYYANLYNYDKDDEGNYVTSDGTIAFYYNKNDGKYYAYYDEDTDVYKQVVECLPVKDDDGNSIVRYDYSSTDYSQYGSVIVVDNTDGSLTDWVTVSFFVATGNESKSYRLEVWNGDRYGTDTNPANSYVFFDNYINEDVSGDYATLLSDSAAALKDKLGLSDKENLPEEYALYYTFTFYDATSYLRYDVNEDEDEEGNPYGSYTQSAYEEQLIYLYIQDTDGTLMNSGSMYAMFLDFTATDVTVTPDDLSTDEGSDSSSDTTTDTNVLLLISSGILAVVLLLVIVLVVIQRLKKKYGKKTKKVKQSGKKDKRYRPERTVEESENASDEGSLE